MVVGSVPSDCDLFSTLALTLPVLLQRTARGWMPAGMFCVVCEHLLRVVFGGDLASSYAGGSGGGIGRATSGSARGSTPSMLSQGLRVPFLDTSEFHQKGRSREGSVFLLLTAPEVSRTSQIMIQDEAYRDRVRPEASPT